MKKRFIVDLILEMSIELMEYFTNSVTVRHAGGNSTLSKLFYVAVCTIMILEERTFLKQENTWQERLLD